MPLPQYVALDYLAFEGFAISALEVLAGNQNWMLAGVDAVSSLLALALGGHEHTLMREAALNALLSPHLLPTLAVAPEVRHSCGSLH